MARARQPGSIILNSRRKRLNHRGHRGTQRMRREEKITLKFNSFLSSSSAPLCSSVPSVVNIPLDHPAECIDPARQPRGFDSRPVSAHKLLYLGRQLGRGYGLCDVEVEAGFERGVYVFLRGVAGEGYG